MPRRLAYLVPLLLLFAFVRLYDVLSFPVFIDEHEHIRWAREAYDWHFFAGANSGRLFGLWWMSLFGLQDDSALFLARVSTGLFNLIGAAVLFDLGRRLVDVRTGALAVVLYAAAPYAVFHERLALTDSYVTVWGLLAAWFALRYARRVSLVDAALWGGALVLAFAAKATGLTLAAIPLLVVVLMTPRVSWRQHIRGLAVGYGLFAAGAVALMVFLRWRGYQYLNAATDLVGTKDTGNIFKRLTDGAEAVWEMDRLYLALPLLLVAGLSALYLLRARHRAALMLMGMALIPLAGVLAFALKYSARYFHFHMPFILLIVAVGLGQLARDIAPRSRAASLAVLVIPVLLWGVLFALPFQRTYFDDPAALALTDLDRLEYVTSDAAGFALPEVAAYLKTQASDQPIRVVGLLANCGGLGYALPDAGPVRLVCPTLRWDGTHQPEVIALIDRLVAESDAPLWIVLERSVYIDLEGVTVPVERQHAFQRPDNLTLIEVLRVVQDS